MIHRDNPIVDRKLAYHYHATMQIHAHAGLIVRYCRQQKTIRVSAANAPRGCWVSVYAGYTGAVAVN